MEWMLMPYRRYADFSGRSCRTEYWMFHLLWVLVLIVITGVLFASRDVSGSSSSIGGPVIDGLLLGVIGAFFLGSLIPMIAVTVRRFHDQDKSGWFYLLNFVPYVGGIIVFVFMCIEGTRGPNQYGSDPLDRNNADIFA